MGRQRRFLLAGAVCMVVAGGVRAQNLLAEDFNYPPTDSIRSPWGGSFASTNHVRVVSPGLSFPGYQGSGIGNAAYFSNLAPGDLVTRPFATLSSGMLYLSYLVNVDSLTGAATAGYVVAFDQAGGATNHCTKLMIKRVSSTQFTLGVIKTSGAAMYGSDVFGTDTTYLVVLKYLWVPGTTTDDTVKLFVSRAGIPLSEPQAAVVNASGSDAVDAGELVLTNTYAQTGLAGSPVRIDGMRLGTSWAGTILSGLSHRPALLPAKCILGQNYPNPFNPSTTIKYELPQSSVVRLSVYDMLGREVSVLVNEKRDAGVHEVEFDASGLASGVYLCRMTAGSFVETRKLVLVR